MSTDSSVVSGVWIHCDSLSFNMKQNDTTGVRKYYIASKFSSCAPILKVLHKFTFL